MPVATKPNLVLPHSVLFALAGQGDGGTVIAPAAHDEGVGKGIAAKNDEGTTIGPAYEIVRI